MQESGGAAARAELGLVDDYSSTSAGQRERMLKSTERLAKTGDRIQQGRAQLLETEVLTCGHLLLVVGYMTLHGRLSSQFEKGA